MYLCASLSLDRGPGPLLSSPFSCFVTLCRDSGLRKRSVACLARLNELNVLDPRLDLFVVCLSACWFAETLCCQPKVHRQYACCPVERVCSNHIHCTCQKWSSHWLACVGDYCPCNPDVPLALVEVHNLSVVPSRGASGAPILDSG